jgi:hypothetical protein
LESLKNIKRENFELTIVVVDNSSKEEFDLKSGYMEDIPLVVVKNKENLGFAGGHNVAIKYAIKNGADYVLILNNDTYVDKNFLEELLKATDRDKKIGVLVPKIYFAPGFEFHKDRYKKSDLGKVFWYAGGEMDWDNVIGRHRGVDLVDKGQFDKTEETEIATGCCMMVKKEVFEKIGLFDEKFYLYYEDADLSEKTKKAGYKIVYVPKSILWHKNAGSAGGSGSVLQDYYITRNRLLFGVRYASFRAKLALIKESFLILLTGRYWQKRGVLDFYLNKFGKGSFKI